MGGLRPIRYEPRDDIAAAKGATQIQISLIGMLHKKPFIVPISGMRRDERIIENLGTADVELADSEFAQIEAELAQIEIHGNRTDADIAKSKYVRNWLKITQRKNRDRLWELATVQVLSEAIDAFRK